jgi:hypothetical protein
MMDLVTLILVLTLTQNVTRLSIALARRLESPAHRTYTTDDHAVSPQRNPNQRRGHRCAR